MKPLTFILMGLIVLGLLVGDFFILGSSQVIEGLVAKELESIFGDALRYEKLDASIDGLIRLRGVDLRLSAEPEAPRLLRCDLLSISLEGRQIKGIRLETPELFLTPQVGDYLKNLDQKFQGTGKIESLPLVECADGRVHFGDLDPLLKLKTPYFNIEKFAFHPLRGEGFYLSGDVRDPKDNPWAVEGKLDLALRRLSVDVQLRELALSNLKDMLPEEIHPEWERWDPRGRARVDLELVTAEGAEPTELTLHVNVEDLSLKLGEMEVSHLAGDVRGSVVGEEAGKARHMRFTLDLKTPAGREALPGGGRMRVLGKIEQIGDQVPFDLSFQLEDAPIEAMAPALPQQYRSLWEQVRPEGRVTIGGTVSADRGASEVKAEIHNARARVGDLGWVEGLHGRLNLSGDTIKIDLLEGRQGPATVRVQGTVQALGGEQPAKLDLKAEAVGMPIARFVEIGDARYGISEIICPWEGETFEQCGAVNLQAEVQGPTDDPRVTLEVQLRENRLAYKPIPLPLRKINGLVRIKPGLTELIGVEAAYPAPLNGASPVAAPVRDGVVLVKGRSDRTGEVPIGKFHVELKNVRINEAFARPLPAQVREILESMKLDGDANANVGVTAKGGGEHDKIDFTCMLQLYGASMDPGLKMENIEGWILLDGAGFTEGGPINGGLYFDSALFAGHRVTKVDTSFTVDRAKLSFGDISAEAYGGKLQAGVTVDTRSGEFKGKFSADRIDLRELAGAIRDYAERGLSGRVSVRELDLRGRLGEPAGFEGEGAATVDEAHLWGVPMLMKLFSLDLERVFEERPRALHGRMRFKIRNSRMVIDELRLEDKDLEIVGEGKIEFSGAIDMIVLTNSDMLGFHIPLISDLFKLAKNQIQGWHATGTFNDPELNMRFFPGTANPKK
jgi:hypothetical protein